jgi:hypothetical protein
MLTDTEVANAARQALEDELAGLAPPADLAARVRARHTRTVRARRAATATVAAVTVGGLATGIIAWTGATTTSPAKPVASHAMPGRAARDQTIVLDGFTIKVASPLHLTVGPHRHVFATKHGELTAVVRFKLFSGKVPGGATRVGFGRRAAYVVKGKAGPSLYVPFLAAAQMHYLVLYFGQISEGQMLKLAHSITVVGRPGYLGSLPLKSRPATHCPCG